MRIFHFRASIVTTRLNTLYPQFIGTFPISTIFTVSAVFSSSPVLTVNTIFSVGTILSVNAILTIGTILTVNAILTIGTIFTVNAIFTICTNTGIFPINIPVPIGTDYYLWRSSIFTYRSLSGIFSIDYPISIFSNCNSRCCSCNSFFTSGRFSCIYSINQPITIIPDRNYRWNSIFSILSIPTLSTYSGILIANPPIHIITNMRCLPILATRSCQIIPKISKIILRYRPHTSRAVRIIQSTSSYFFLPQFKSTFSIQTVLTF